MGEKKSISEIQSTLWAMANKLRGTMDASEYKNYILSFMFYRYLSEKQMMYMKEQELFEIPAGINENEAFAIAVKIGNNPIIKEWSA
ncbi:type I restriction-modification system subunit M N-terminal domain-containing protein [Faecalibaculum rodentium]|uniref:type I restriction-modification system subunit M N-terminal domain-containing protein n=1 Tax=Faecalibaculum rodentium TaxID=1702221 RepID=UPI0025B77999|nr:type I restriction-modification system subunit M N-terminal domain-containing protein [Faecalibaculum rodentium]